MTYFDSAANTWDNERMHVDRALTTFEVIRNKLTLLSEHRILDFGAGTGLLGFKFVEHVGSVDLYDISEGMRSELRAKASSLKKSTINVVGPEALNPGVLDHYNIVTSLMVLHHIIDTEAQINEFSRILAPGGHLCIADLFEEDGSFHSHLKDYKGHNGFQPPELARILEKHHLCPVYQDMYFTIKKNNKDYPMFLLIAVKH